MRFTKTQCEKYTKRAEAARAEAEKAFDGNVREGFLRIAREYERMAAQAERLDSPSYPRAAVPQTS